LASEDRPGSRPYGCFIMDEAGRYVLARGNFAVSATRFLEEMSVERRYERLRHRVAPRRFTPQQAQLAQRHRETSQYLEVDFANVLLHERILLDRTIALSRQFLCVHLPKGQQPSFSSFHSHRDWFAAQETLPDILEEYATYMRDQTSWFDAPLKIIRDKFTVHAGPQHLRSFVWVDHAELMLMLLVPQGRGIWAKDSFKRVEIMFVSVPTLCQEMVGFLTWFADTGCRMLAHKPSTPAG